MADSASAILKRHAALEAQAQPYWNVCQDIAEMLGEADITFKREPGSERNERVFDATAIKASENLASMIHGTMTPSTQPWVSFALRDEEMDQKQEVREWLEDVATRIHKALRQSNFSTSVHEMDLDLVRYGTGCMLIEEREPESSGGFAGFRFTTIACGKYVLTEDKDGRADGCIRKVPMSRRAVLERFNPKMIPEGFREKAQQKPDEVIEIIHAVYPRRDRAYNQVTGKPKAGAKNMPWASCYVLQEPKTILEEGGYEEFPFVIPRWRKSTGEVYGRGPSHSALPDIRTLNAFVQFMLQAIPLAMQPPTMERSDTVIGDPDLTPGGRNVIESNGAINEAFGFMDTKYRPDIATDFRVQYAEGIRSMYHHQELQLREGPQMTATEVQVRYELMQRLLGPTTGRLEAEFLSPFTWRCFAIMARRNAFKPLPGVLTEAVGNEAVDLDIEYEGPLARAQRTIEITAQDRVVAFIVGITEALGALNPSKAAELWDVINLDRLVKDRAEITGLPADSLNDPDEIEAMRAERKQAEAQRNALTQAQAMSEVGRNLTPVMEATKGMAGGAAKGKAA